MCFQLLRVLLDKDKEHRNVVCSRLKEMPDRVSTRAYSEIEANFKALTRSLLALGQSREVRDLFVCLVEKVADPLRAMQLERGEVQIFLGAYADALKDDGLMIDNSEGGVHAVLEKYMATLTPCILAVY